MSLQGFVLVFFLLSTSCSVDVTRNQSVSSKCPERCICSEATFANFNGHLQTVNCSKQGLREFPSDIPFRTEALILSKNMFQNLSSLPVLPHLRILDLSHNRIHSLDNRRIYDNIGRLQNLYLNGNAIRILQHGSFSGLKYLDVLDLSQNALQKIEIHAFGGLNHLQELNLNHNFLRELKRIWLLSVSSIIKLELAENFLYAIDKQVFDSLSNLVHLDLSANTIAKIDSEGFKGLHALKFLNLSHNNLKTVPSSIMSIPELNILLLDFNNFNRIETNAFVNSNITEISLSFQPYLRVIEKGAFTNLPKLVTLQIHDNKKLIFIHPNTFINTSHIHQLFLHNNALMSLPMAVKNSLTDLNELHLYNNPLHCDCNVYWIKQELIMFAEANITDIYIKSSDKLLCDTPTSQFQVPLRQISVEQIPPLCPPTTLALFSDSLNLTIGDDLYLECQAIGVPEPQLYWLLPKGKVLNSSVENKRVVLLDETAIFLSGLRQSDEGTYGCEAWNQMGYDVSSAQLHVMQKDLKLVPLRISKNFITVEWRGSIPRLHLQDFQLHYRESSQSDSQTLYLNSAIHRCTIGGLKPLTTYEICIVYMHDYVVHCLNITTEHEITVKKGITTITTPKIIAGVATVVGATLVLCFVIVFVRKFRKRKGYCEPPIEKGDTTAQIPLENLYQPSNPQLCSSRTALLPNSQI
ncbi:leucine-rich repeat neuronal protein 1-like [Gigantopelta aegis]|uniref:leucine-rich repeat neuronal protein 1-like n=1 Tax=Gigantopelta aegis TaxID=1735272 RepID=UPI001B88D1E1|nr:leucine-rich repeat neuronal protein 1-like [Gigantopelta aegis]XP_041348073.1 leucine-rich repeat neuronal protein 1-like [Gigantopelta aegis]